MSLQATYDALRRAALPRLARGAAELDTLLDSARDTRRGLTLLARPPAAVTAALLGGRADFKNADPAQYYYPASNVHVTILSIISCYPGFELQDLNLADYRAALRRIIQFIPAFELTYRGLTASAGAVLAQGFPEGNALPELRTQPRNFFQSSDLQHSIDQRYPIQTAHSTLIRFRKPVRDPLHLLASLRKYERYFFGTFEVASLELVYNDWYQRAANTVVLDEYLLTG